MSPDEGEHSDRIAGRPLDDAVETVVAEDDARDADEVRRVLSTITDDGVVSEDAVEAALAELSKVVSTPETRVELAAIALEDARAAAEPVQDLDVVEHRLAAFEDRLDTLEVRVEELGVALRSLVDSDAGLYTVADRIRELTTAANRAQQAADELQVDLEEFEQWLDDADRRYDQLGDELDALAVSLDGLGDSTEEAAGALDVATETHKTLNADPVADWLDLTFRHRVVDLLLDDLRLEIAELRAWPGTETHERATELEARLDSLRERWTDLDSRLDDVGPTDYYYADHLAEFEAAVDDFEPPIDWNEVQATLDEYRSAVDGLD